MPDFTLAGKPRAAARNAESYRETAAFLFSEYSKSLKTCSSISPNALRGRPR